MPFPRIRKLNCEVASLLGNGPNIPKYTFFNPSSADPYIYIRTIEKLTNVPENINTITIFDRKSGVLKSIHTPPNVLIPTCGFYQGIEDVRIFIYRERLWFIASSTHVTLSLHSQMMIGYFDKNVTEVEFIQFLDFNMKPIKNMCPFVYQDKICVIDTYTLTIHEITCEKNENDTDVYKPIVLKKLAPCAGLEPFTMRGSTSPVHLHGNIWGCVVHEHIRQAKDKTMSLSYISYWLEFDIERGMVTSFSSPFIVAQWGIEFVSGIEYYKDRDEIELFLGVNDQHAIVARTKLHELRVGYQ